MSHGTKRVEGVFFLIIIFSYVSRLVPLFLQINDALHTWKVGRTLIVIMKRGYKKTLPLIGLGHKGGIVREVRKKEGGEEGKAISPFAPFGF